MNPRLFATFLVFCACWISAQSRDITILAPVGGEIYHVGDTLVVRWVSDSMVQEGITISISVDSGNNYMTGYISGDDKIPRSDPGWGLFKRWVIPEMLTFTVSGRTAGGQDTLYDTLISSVSSRCRVKLYGSYDCYPDEEGNFVCPNAVSNAFTIQPRVSAEKGMVAGSPVPLLNAAPNPFTRAVTLSLNLQSGIRPGRLVICDLTGKVVEDLTRALDRGGHSAVFNGQGRPSGYYFARLTGPSIAVTRLLQLCK